MKNLLLPISVAFMLTCTQACTPKSTVTGSKTTRIEHPAPDQAKIDSLKEVRGRDKK